MPKPLEYQRDQVLDAALRIFWKQGYEGTGITQLEEAMGIKRSSIYHAFGDKRGLFIATLEHYNRGLEGGFLGELGRSSAGLDSIRIFFSQVLEYQAQASECRGCFMGCTAAEAEHHTEEVNEMVAAYMAHLEASLLRALKRAKQLDQLTSSAPLSGQARMLMAVIHGLAVMSKARVEVKVMNSAARSALAAL